MQNFSIRTTAISQTSLIKVFFPQEKNLSTQIKGSLFHVNSTDILFSSVVNKFLLIWTFESHEEGSRNFKSSKICYCPLLANFRLVTHSIFKIVSQKILVSLQTVGNSQNTLKNKALIERNSNESLLRPEMSEVYVFNPCQEYGAIFLQMMLARFLIAPKTEKARMGWWKGGQYRALYASLPPITPCQLPTGERHGAQRQN